MERSNSYCQELGLDRAHFYTAAIKQFTPPCRPDIVLALHACDTATGGFHQTVLPNLLSCVSFQ